MSPDVEVVAVNVSREKGTCKQPVPRIEIGPTGVVGDAHAGPGHRQVSLLSQESIDRFAAEFGRSIRPGEFAENITVRGLDLGKVAILDRLRFGEAELEVTQIGKECHGAKCAIFQQVGKCVMPTEGVFARVVASGSVQPGDHGVFHPRNLRFLVVTLSDRAAAGQYADRSGPRICEMLANYFAGKRWHLHIETALMPDDAVELRRRLTAAIESQVDVIFTTGGTGIGPRDITPEVVAPLCDKFIPGIMEHIRVKFGAAKPNALLSRSLAGVAGKSQIYALPGSVRAVEEYLGEIVKTLEHVTRMLHGIDVHG